MTKQLKISPDLALPPDAVTSTIIVYGGKGMGKTNLGSVLVEEFDAAHQRFAVIDPMGVWWGLRWEASGRGAGIKLLILGGVRGDLPIEPTSGERVADLVVDDDVNVIIDISRWPDGRMWAIAERIRFVRDYAKRVYQRQGEKRSPLNQVIDEAARFIPQVVRAGELELAACMGAIAVLVEEGRNVGVGVTLITQRSARLNKDVAELADCMIAFRTVGPNSKRAVLDWLGEHVDKSRIKDFDEKLRSLPRGTALVVSPGWLEFEGVAAMRRRKMFDSSATPETGKELKVYGPGAAVDVDKYRARWADVIERANANDPKVLKARIAELEKQLAAKGEAHTVERAVVKDAQLQRIGVLIEQGDGLINRWDDRSADAHASLQAVHDKAAALFEDLGTRLRELGTAIASTKAERPNPANVAKLQRAMAVLPPLPRVTTAAPKSLSDGTKLEPRCVKVLGAIAWWQSIGVDRPKANGVALVSGYSPVSSSFEKARGMLKSAELIDYPEPGTMRLTAAGEQLAPAPDIASSLEALHDKIIAELEPRSVKLLRVAIEAWPTSIGQDRLAEASGYSADSSSFEKARGQLRSLGLIEYPRPGEVQATRLLFPEGLS